MTRREVLKTTIIVAILLAILILLFAGGAKWAKKNLTASGPLHLDSLDGDYVGKTYYLIYAPRLYVFRGTEQSYVKFIDDTYADVCINGEYIHGKYGVNRNGESVIIRQQGRNDAGKFEVQKLFSIDINDDRIIWWENGHSPYVFEESHLFNSHTEAPSDPETVKTGLLGRWTDGVTCYEFYDNWSGCCFFDGLTPETDELAKPFTWMLDGDLLSMDACKYLDSPDRYHIRFSDEPLGRFTTWYNMDQNPDDSVGIRYRLVDQNTD